MNAPNKKPKKIPRSAFNSETGKAASLKGGGRPKLTFDLEMLIHDTRLQVKQDIHELWNLPYAELHKLANSHELHSGKAALASLLNNAIQSSDWKTVDLFLNRIIGKPKETVEMSGPDGGNIPIDTTITDVLKAMLLEKAKE